MENEKNYYFIKPYDENLAKPPKESYGQILSEMYLHPFSWNYRTTRKSYWLGILTNAVLSILCSIIFSYGMNESINAGLRWIDIVISCCLLLWLFLAGLGQTIRRLHDVGYSGYWYWIAFTGVGAYFLLYLQLQPSKQKPVKWNSYLYTNDRPYGDYIEELDKDDTPEPSIRQIIKEHFFDCFKWDARSTRTSFWVGMAINQVLGIFFGLIYYGTGIMLSLASFTDFQPNDTFMAFFPIIAIFLIIFLAVGIWCFFAELGHTVRRLHDAGFSGWWYWLSLIPIIGNILLSFLLFHPTTKNEIKWQGYLFKDSDLRK